MNGSYSVRKVRSDLDLPITNRNVLLNIFLYFSEKKWKKLLHFKKISAGENKFQLASTLRIHFLTVMFTVGGGW